MDWMAQALKLAEQGLTTCKPNPMVGCVIVKDNHLIGSGFHVKAGDRHAEIIALEQTGQLANGADVYLTLEPCSHFGLTPPCVNSLINAGVKNVHIALPDPNPLVSGQGIQKLRESGIGVILGQYQEEAYQLNKVFFHYTTQKQPFVIAKWAMSLNGKFSQKTKTWITSKQARAHSHRVRAQVSAIMVGANTVRQDNPRLTVRHDCFDPSLSQPRPIVMTLSGNIPFDSNIFAPGRNSIVITSDKTSSDFLTKLDKYSIEHYQFPAIENRLNLSDILDKIASLKISSILVEGGNQLLTSFFDHNLVNKVYAYIAPKIIRGNSNFSSTEDCFAECTLHSQQTMILDPDVCVIGYTPKTPRTYNDFLDLKG